ncbi:hypothetical protein ACBJ59_47540 [Nonomuraea sp. MTCD27]|uniref:hypothetical protein n=1 Tax=Nonomuraea sp. MTCD27 TaxID=1676747 RepID=UPI0035C21E93
MARRSSTGRKKFVASPDRTVMAAAPAVSANPPAAGQTPRARRCGPDAAGQTLRAWRSRCTATSAATHSPADRAGAGRAVVA